MRAILTLGLITWLFIATLTAPFVGTLAMAILNYLSPERVAFGFVRSLNLSLVFGILTVVAATLFDRKKHFPIHPIPLLIILYLIWITITTQYAWVHDGSAQFKWDRTVKTIGFSAFSIILISTRVRLEAFIWTLVLCVGYYVSIGAVKTILSGGGGFTVVGASGGFLGPRSHLATAIVMIMPLVWYLKQHTLYLPKSRLVDWTAIGFLVACLLAIVGSQSRTGLVAVSAVGFLAVMATKQRIKVLALMAILGLVVLAVAPSKWFDRMETITNYQEDASANSRLDSWKFAIDVANQSPVTGGGFRVFESHISDGPQKWLDAHSIYFEVLGEQGYVGLLIYLSIIGTCLLSCRRTAKASRGIDELKWAYDLSRMSTLSMVGFCVGGAFVTIASHPELFDLALIVTTSQVLVRKHISNTEASRA